jgi:hypothetical protein
VINAGSAEAESDAPKHTTERQPRHHEKSEVGAGAQSPTSLPEALSKRTAPDVRDRARDYSDLRRYMLDR